MHTCTPKFLWIDGKNSVSMVHARPFRPARQNKKLFVFENSDFTGFTFSS